MAKGTRSKGGGTATKEVNKENYKNTADNRQQNYSTDHPSNGKGGRQNRNKQRIVEDDNPKMTSNDENAQTDGTQTTHNSQLAATAKHPEHQKKQQLQPTSEQLMIAQLIAKDEKSDDPNQRHKIQQVIDITGKSEEIVATALFDAGWDENLAIGMLLEGGDQLTAWEETGKGGKKKKKEKTADDKDDWDEDANWGNDSREKSRQRGPPRMRRGGNSSQGDRDRGATKSGRDMTNGNQGSGATDEWDNNQFDGRGKGGDRGGMPRRGRGGGVGGRGGERSSFQGGRGRRGGGPGTGPSREQAPTSIGNGGIAQDSAVIGFSGSIDTWNPGPSNDGGSSGGGESRDGQRRPRGGNSKDAFDNAGNWGDDFPAADDWDNEEYTGSLADTKVFTASSGKPNSKHPQQRRNPQDRPQQTAQNQQPLKQPQAIGPNRNSYNADSSLNGPTQHDMAPSQQQPPTAAQQLQSSLVSQQTVPPSSAAVGAPTSSYSQSIDLSTLLHKPTTQSSIGTGSQQQSLLQFTQQATDSLKAAVGIGQPGQSSHVSQSKASDLGSYGSYGPPSAAGTALPNSGYGQTSAFGSIKQNSNVNSSSNQNLNQQQQAGSNYNRSRMPPPSKIPNSAVEMPGDSLARLDVQFGGLDLQFGGGGSSANSDSVSGFEFNGNAGQGQSQAIQQGTIKEDKYLSGDKTKNVSVNVSAVSSSSGVPSGPNNIDAYGHPQPPSAKEVSKSLSNAMSGGKLVGQGNDSYDPRKQVASVTGAGSYSSRGPPPPPGGMDMKAANDVLSGYAQQNSYNSYNKQQSGYGAQYSQNQYVGPANPNQSNPYGSSSASSSSGYASQNNYSSSANQQAQTNYKSTSASANYPALSGQPNDSLNKAAVGGFGADSNLASVVSAANHGPGNAAAVLGLTSTTNALSGKVSATTASKVNVPNLPPGVASMLPPQYMASLPAAAFYGLQQPAAAMYNAAYGNAGLEDLAALQRQAGLHTLQTTGYYDPSSQYAASSLAAAAGRNQNQDGGSSLNSLSTSISSATTMTGSVSTNTGSSVSSSNMNSGSDKSAFGSVAAAMNNSVDSASSPSNPNNQSANLQQAGLNFANNAFAAQQAALPPGYAYFYGQVPNLQAAYGAQAAGVYPGAPMAVPTAAGGTATTQFQKSAYGTSYGSGYDNLGQGQPSKQDFNNYSTGNGTTGKSSGAQGSSGTGGPGHQYWGNSALTSTQLW